MKYFHSLSAAIVGTSLVIIQPNIAIPQALDEQVISAIAKEVTVVINGQNSGSGTIISKQGNIYSVLTAKHVVATPDEYEIFTSDGTKHALDYRTVNKLPGVDLAVVQFTSNQNYRVAVLGNSEEVKEGTRIYISGWPHPGPVLTDRIYQMTSGNLSGRPLQALQDGYALVYTNTTRSGMSGGPILDDRGRVIGVHGRADGEPIFNPETGQIVNVKSGFNLGIPINTFFQLAGQNKVNLTYSRANYSLFKDITTDNIISSVAIAPDGKNLVTGDQAGEVKLWDLSTGTVKKNLGNHSKTVGSVVISPDGQTLVSGSSDGTIKIWSFPTGQLKTTLSGYWTLAISPDGQTLAGVSADLKGIQLWNLSTGQPKKTLNLGEKANSIAFSTDGQTLVTADPEVKIWDLNSNQPPRQLKTSAYLDDKVRCVAVSGQILATSNLSQETKLWNLQNGEFLRTFKNSNSNVDFFACSSMMFDANGQIILSGSPNPWQANLLNLQTGQFFNLPKARHPVTFSRDGETIVTGGTTGFRHEYLLIWRSPGS